jgi:hypothetical protein
MPPGHRPGSQGHALEGGVPWESESGGFLNRWWETLTATNFKGRQFYAAVAQGDDAMSAVLFSTVTHLIIAAAALAIGGALMALFFTAFIGMAGSAGGPRAAAALAGTSVAIFAMYGLGVIFVAGLVGFVGPWLTGGLHHLCLLMVGGVGDGKGYMDTVRVNAYGGASAMLFYPIPGVGPLVFLAFHAINHVTGYDVVHDCGGGKAFLAWVAPMFVGCCCNCMLWTMLGSLV